MAVTSHVPRGDVTITLNYYTPPADGAAPFNWVGTPAEGQPDRNYHNDFQETLIQDIRGRESEFNLDQDAFEVITGVPPSKEQSFTDDASIKENYYPEVESLLLNHIKGSNKIFIFDHTVRRASPNAPRAPVLRVHIDQTAASAEKRLRKYFPDEADELLKGRYRIVNVWRPLNKNPVEASPLSYASTSSLEDKDVIAIKHFYQDGYTGETAAVNYNPGQKWYYLSGMTGDERLLLECFDSESLKPGSKIGGRVPHSAFTDPRTRKDAEGRESIEVRALVFSP